MRVVVKFRKARKECLYKRFQEPKPLATHRPVVGEKSGLDRDRVDAFADCDDVWIVLVTESRWKVIMLQRRGNRQWQEVIAIGLCVARQEVDRFSRHEQRGEDSPAPHPIQCGVQPQVHLVDLHAQAIEHLTAKYSARAAFLAQIDCLASKVRWSFDLRPREEMEFFCEKGGNVDKLAADIPVCPCLPEPVDQDDGRDRHVGACQSEYVQDVAVATVSHHGQHAQCHLAARAGLLTAGQRGCNFLSYSELGALRPTGNQSGRVPVLRYSCFLPRGAFFLRRHLRGLTRRIGGSCLCERSLDLYAEPGRCNECAEQTDSDRSADVHRSDLFVTSPRSGVKCSRPQQSLVPPALNSVA